MANKLYAGYPLKRGWEQDVLVALKLFGRKKAQV